MVTVHEAIIGIIMEEKTIAKCCLGCLVKSNEFSLELITLQNEGLKAILQVI